MSAPARKQVRVKASVLEWHSLRRYGWASAGKGPDLFISEDVLHAAGLDALWPGMSVRVTVERESPNRLAVVAVELA